MKMKAFHFLAAAVGATVSAFNFQDAFPSDSRNEPYKESALYANSFGTPFKNASYDYV